MAPPCEKPSNPTVDVLGGDAVEPADDRIGRRGRRRERLFVTLSEQGEPRVAVAGEARGAQRGDRGLERQVRGEPEQVALVRVEPVQQQQQRPAGAVGF